MNRQNQILAAILVAQIALVAAIFWPRTVASETAGGLLVKDVSPTDVVAMTISDADGNRIALAKDGEDWVLPEAGDYPAKADSITPFLEKLAGIQTNRLVTQTEASHKRLKVAQDDFERLVEFTLADGSTNQLYVGSSAGASATHVRVDSQEEVYLTGELSSFDANTAASAWIDTLYFTVPTTATVALTLENENGTFEFENDGGTWTMAGLDEDEVFDETTLTTLINQATSVRMTEPIGTEEQASFGLDNPAAVVTLETGSTDSGQADDKTYTLRIGAKDEEDNSYVLSSSESPYYVRISEFTANNFIQKTRDDFLAAPPTSEPEAGATDSVE
jgi:YD repeat-containing protein